MTKTFCDRGTLLPKNLPIGTSIRHIISIYWDANRHYVNLVFKFKPDSKSKYFHRLELAAIYSQIKRRTISNFFIRKHFDFILQHCEVKNVVITYEGHAYEYIINNLCEVNDVNLCLYQHSPFSLGRFSMLNKKLINNNFVAFSSKIVRDWFVANDYLHKSHSFIVGTPKSSKPKFSQFELSEKKFILLAPEGVNSALKKYLSLARQLLKIGFVDVRLRVHPDMNLFYYHWCKLIIFRGRKGVDRSIDNLDSDLCRSKYCVFTSSSVGIESLTHNCQPIFFGTELENIYCNPLFICASRFDTFLKIEGIELKTIKLKAKKSFLYYDKLKPDALYKMMI